MNARSLLLASLLTAFMIISICAVSRVAHAREGGSSAGDGGKGIVCVGGTPQLLDLYEVRQTKYARLILGGSFSGQTLPEAFAAILSSAEINYPRLYPRIKALVDGARLMDISARRVAGPLETTEDGPLPIQPADEPCRVVQLAVTSRSDYRLTMIDEAYWSRMDALDQAFLLIHETLQTRDAISRDSSSIDSTKRLRKFVGLLALLLPTPDEKREFESMW